jgi:ketol-acid reductoisomerase
MKDVLTDIQDGTFTRNWIAEYAAGLPTTRKLKQADLDHPIEAVGKKLRAKMVAGLRPRRQPSRPRRHDANPQSEAA